MYIPPVHSQAEAAERVIVLLLIWGFFGLCWLYQTVRNLITGSKTDFDLPKIMFYILSFILVVGISLSWIAHLIYKALGG